MNILVTGHKGMLGSVLYERLVDLGHQVRGADLPEVDLTQSQQVQALIQQVQPQFIYNCAAFTDVDRCESEYDQAYSVNATAVKILAESAKEIPVVHISTDYVFDGQGKAPYEVDQALAPLSAYGKTKAAGEDFLVKLHKKHFIVRTAWLYGARGKNFVETIIRLSQEKTELKVVDDQRGAPTLVDDLVIALVNFMDSQQYGIYHFTNNGETTWYGFAAEIINDLGLATKVIPCKTSEYPRPAPRPIYSVLSLQKIKETFDIEIPGWQDALKRYLKKRQT